MNIKQFFGTLLCAVPLLAFAQPQIDYLKAYQTTLDNNEGLFSKQAQLNADQEQLRQAWGGVLPNISVSGAYGKGQYDTAFQKGQEDDFHRTSLHVVQPIYSARKFNTIAREQDNSKASESQFELDQYTTLLEMTQAYLDLARAQRLERITQQELDDHQIKSRRLEAMLERGLANKMDMLEARSKQDEIRANLVTAQNQVMVNQRRLERLLGANVDTIQPINETLWQRARDLVAQPDWYQVAQRHAPNLKVAELAYQVAKQDLSVQKAGHHPEVNLRAEVTNSDSYENTFRDNRKIQLEFTLPLYEGGITSSRIRAAHNLVSSKQYALRDSERFVQVKLKETLTKLQASIANLDALEQSIASNQAYLDAAEKGLDYGLRGVFDVLEAKTKMYNTERRMLDEIYANLFAQFELLYLIGKFDYATLSAYLEPHYQVSELAE
jgi:TolC family type I secretion outer membrane protein